MKEKSTTTYQPVVAIMGHIDHGKSTLLDYIRKTNVVDGEAGGITQHLSAYEIAITYQGEDRRITFIDTPGHAAFSGMRARGANAADIAILVVSAEDGVKTQTIEALKSIKNSGIPFIVAINKIDKPGANIEKTKQMLAEQEVLVEGYGGTIPWVSISAKIGTGVNDLLDTILLVVDIEGLKSDSTGKVGGIVIESNLDPRRGISATIIIRSGKLTRGLFVVSGKAISTTRIMENFQGKTIDEATPGMSVNIVGFDQVPDVGSAVEVFDNKRQAEKFVEESNSSKITEDENINTECKVVPIIIKTDVYGTTEAIESELKKISVEGLRVKIIGRGTGSISEGDIRLAQSDKESLILGFNVGLDSKARDLNEQAKVEVKTFDIIYKLTEWLQIQLEKRRPRTEVREVIGSAKVIKCFSKTKERQVVGCRIDSGIISQGAKVTIMRRDFAIATGNVIEVQQAKQKLREVSSGECGIMIECKNDIAIGDVLEAFVMITK